MSTEEMFACPECDREFTTERGLNVHMRVHDNEDTEETKEEPKEEPTVKINEPEIEPKENPKPPLKQTKKKRWITDTMYVI